VTVLRWFLLGFATGSLPFSVWIGRWVLRDDIRRYGDANPGATNVFRAGGKGAGIAAALLDALKAALPVGLARFWAGLGGYNLALVAWAPLLGHAFSPLLRFRGGKAVAATFGAWAGLMLWEGPTVLGLGLLLTTRITRGGRAVMGAMALLFGYLLLAPPAWNRLARRPPRSVLLLAWVLHAALLVYTQRTDLFQARTGRNGTLPPLP
jgi:glycerol-3-phosphate acyltransferase PlsY